MTHIRMILKHLCLSGMLDIIQSKASFTCTKFTPVSIFAIWSKNTHISKSIFNLRSHANSVHISILKVTLDQLSFDSSHVQTDS